MLERTGKASSVSVTRGQASERKVPPSDLTHILHCSPTTAHPGRDLVEGPSARDGRADGASAVLDLGRLPPWYPLDSPPAQW